MPATPNITLDLRNFASNDPGWVTVMSSSNQQYSYKYAGGDDNVGGLEQTVGQGRDTAPIRLVSDQRYEINTVNFVRDTNQQLSWQGDGKRAGSIVDANVAVESAKYTVVIVDTGNNGCTVYCDPNIINR
jgi:hypothetical protein